MKNSNIKVKIALLAGGLMLAIVLLGSFGIYNSRFLSGNLHKITETNLDVMRGVVLLDMYHDGLRGIVMRGELGFKTKNRSEFLDAQTELEEMEKEVTKDLGNLAAEDTSPEFKSQLATVEIEMKSYIGKAKNFFSVANSGEDEKTEAAFGEFELQFKQLEAVLEKFADSFNKENQEYVDHILSRAETLELSSLVVLVVVLMLGTFFSVAVGKSIVTTLSKISGSLTTGANELGMAIGQLSSASSNLSSSAQQQAAALQETAASAEEISAMVKKTSEGAQQSESASAKSREKAEEGQKAIEEMVRAIQEINGNNDTVMSEVTSGNERISEIVKVIQEIGNKTKVINDIVFQTKLLSFNASVEAARAGEHGKGFAVVAEEVGNLAAMSGNAAKEITSLLDSSLHKVGSIVTETKSKVESLMVTSRQTVNRGAAVAEQCSEVFREIFESAKNVVDLVSSIAQASREQSNGVAEISKAINQLNQATHVNATAAEDCARASETISQQVENLRYASDDLKKLVDGGRQAARFDWQESYKSGNVKFDFAHQKVFESFARFLSECQSGTSGDEGKLNDLFGSAIEKLGECFDSEIDYLEELRAPFEAHDQSHKSILKGLAKFQADIASGNFSVSDLVTFLNANYIPHLRNVDRISLLKKPKASLEHGDSERAA